MDDSAPPQASTVQLTPYSLPLRLSSRLLQSHRIHTPALCERFSKKHFAVFECYTSRKTPDKCRISNVERKGSVIEKQGFGSTGSSTNKEVQNTVDLKKNSMKLWQDKNFGLSIEFPLDSISKSCVCPRGTADWMKTENRSPISSAFRGGRGCGDGDSERFAGKT